MFYIIRTPYEATPYVRAEKTQYRGMGKTPTAFANKAEADLVLAHYKLISKNSGKTPSKLTVVKVEV